MVPALIAAGEAYGASGRDLMLAHAAGYEVGATIGRCVNPHHSEKGWHPTATLGVFAVTAACARLLKLTAAETETALALATSLSAGTKANFGTMTKPLHAGQCARGGLLAALLARKGFTANSGAFEHKQGFFNLFAGPGHYDIHPCARGLGRVGDRDARARATSSTRAATARTPRSRRRSTWCRRHGPFDPRTVARVDSWTPARGLAHTDRPEPDSALEAKFSVQYCVARALLDGKVVLEHFEGDAYRDPEVRDLLKRVHAAPYTGKLFDTDDPFDAEVKITLADGTTFSEKVDRPLGRTSDNPIAHEHMKAKFENCAARVLASEAAAAACRMIESLDTLGEIRDLTRHLEPAGGGRSGITRAAGKRG